MKQPLRDTTSRQRSRHGPQAEHFAQLVCYYYLVITDGLFNLVIITWLLLMDSHTPGALVTQNLMVTGAHACSRRRPSHHQTMNQLKTNYNIG